MEEHERIRALAEGYALPYVDVERISVEQATLHSISAEVAIRCRAFPLKRIEGHMWVAFANPLDAQAIAEIGRASGCRIHPVDARPDRIDEALAKHYL